MKKRVLSLLLALCFVVGMFPVNVNAAQLDNGLMYEVYDDYVVITGYIDDATEVVIPAEIEGLPVTEIGSYAFYNCTSLTSIDLPDSLTYIDDCAFYYCTSLTCIDIPASVTRIRDGNFSGCTSLTGIYVAEDNPAYSSDTRGVLFDKEKTTLIQAPEAISGSYAIPDSVTKIYSCAFEDCASLTSIDISDSVTEIVGGTFDGCTSLTSIEIPDSVTKIGDWAFKDCTSLTNIALPDSLTHIGDRTFYDCTSLTSITLPGSLRYIGDEAFEYCISLTSIDIPDSVTVIGDLAFSDCASLTGIHVDANNPNFSSDDRGVLFDKEKTELIQAPGAIADSYMIPDSVTYIGMSAFSGCANLTSINIPGNVTYIYFPEDASDIWNFPFSGCTSLTGIHVDEDNPDYSSDNRGVLYNKEKTKLIKAPGAIMGSYAIPDSVTYISDCAFEDCTSLTSIDVPDSVTRICDYFSECTSLTGIHVDADNPNYSSDDRGVLFDKEKTILFRAPGAIADSYTIPDSVTNIGYEAFYGCANLSSIDISDSITYIGYEAFYGCISLTSIDIPDSVTYIEWYAFSDCSCLTSIYFEGDAPEFGSKVFVNVTAIAYYPASNDTWIEEMMQDYGGDITWIAYDPNHTHDYVAVVTAPTCTESGCTAYTCTICGYSYVGDYTDALGHEYEDGVCIRCGAEDPDYEEVVENPFTDVPAGSFYEEPVLWAIENGITNGLTADSFGPTATCNRAQVVTFLWRAAGCPEPTSTENPFADVAPGSFYEKPVLWAVEKGITNGLSATEFGPNTTCNRAQVVTFLYRAMENPEVTSTECPFTDVEAGLWYEKPILWAVENGITNGMGDGTFGVNGICNRAQVVTFLYRAYN